MAGMKLVSYVCASVACFIAAIEVVCASTCGDAGRLLFLPFMSLRDIPIFKPDDVACVSRINLSSNNIGSINDQAFIAFRNNSVSSIDLSNNRIATIANNAFVGVKNMTSLFLNDNRLSSLSPAFQTLRRLQNLTLTGNPLLSLDPRVMSVIGNTLFTFEVDLQDMPHWPNQLHYLHHLQTLKVSHLFEQQLSRAMFLGFQNTLRMFQLDHSWLESVSSVICDLPNLWYLEISHSPYLNESKKAVFEHCTGNLSPVTTLRLETNSQMTVFPVLGRTFSSIETLYYLSNNLEVLNLDSDLDKDLVTSLNLYNNKFTSVPRAINSFINTVVLDLSINMITRIEDVDFEQLTSIKYLELAHNPLVYISNNAFRHNTKLISINISDTRLHQLPTSLTLLPNLNGFYVSGTMVECTCDLANLKGWNVTSVHFDFGPVKCYQSSILLKDFIQHDLNNC